MNKVFLACLFTLCVIHGMAQTQDEIKKFGDVSPEDFAPTDLEQFGDYKAIILQNTKQTRFDCYEQYVRLFDTYHIRYKALADNFIDSNKIVIPYSGRYNYDEMLDIKVRIYSLHNSKVVERKIKYKDIKYVNRDSIKSWVTINLPNIQKGEILEMQYTKASYNYLRPDVWNFHAQYPCKVSKVVANFPDFMDYEFIVTGDNINIEHHRENKFISIMPTYGPLTGVSFRLHSVLNTYLAHNTMPEDTTYAFMPSKKYWDGRLIMRPNLITDNIKDFEESWKSITRLMYVYAEPGNRYLSEWEAYNQVYNPGFIKFERDHWIRFTRELKRSPYFWKPILKSFPVDEQLSEIFEHADETDTVALIAKIHHYVTSHVKWDGTYSNTIFNKPETVLQQGIGNSAEINATLISLLRRAGLRALPALSTTRDYGTVDTTYVNTLQFNNILAYVESAPNSIPRYYLLDATSSCRNFNVLNVNNINNRYLVMDIDYHFFVSATPCIENYVMASITKNDDGNGLLFNEKTSGSMAGERCDYYRTNAQNYLNNYYNIDNKQVTALIITSKEENGDFGFQTRLANQGLTAKQLLLKLLGNNPFPEEVRTVPVDFVVPRKYLYQVIASENSEPNITEWSTTALNGALLARLHSYDKDGKRIFELYIEIARTQFPITDYYAVREFFSKIPEALER